MVLEKADATPLPLIFLSDELHLLLERQGLLPHFFKSSQAKLPDLAARDAEDLAQGGVAIIGGVVAGLDEFAVLQLEDVVDFPFCECFHGVLPKLKFYYAK